MRFCIEQQEKLNGMKPLVLNESNDEKHSNFCLGLKFCVYSSIQSVIFFRFFSV